MTPPPLERESLTGAVRGRPRLLSHCLTMQVQVRVESAPFTFLSPPPPRCPDAASWIAAEQARIAASWRTVRLYWRDATWQDQLHIAQNAQATP